MSDESKYSIDDLSFLHIPRQKPEGVQPEGVRRPPPTMDIISLSGNPSSSALNQMNQNSSQTNVHYQNATPSSQGLQRVESTSQSNSAPNPTFQRVGQDNNSYAEPYRAMQRVESSTQQISSEPVRMTYVESSSQNIENVKGTYQHVASSEQEIVGHTHDLVRPESSRPLAEHTQELSRPESSRPVAEHTHDLVRPESSRPAAEHTHELVRPESSRPVVGHSHELMRPAESAHELAEHTHELVRPAVSGNPPLPSSGTGDNTLPGIEPEPSYEMDMTGKAPEESKANGLQLPAASTREPSTETREIERPASYFDSMKNSIGQEIENIMNLPQDIVDEMRTEARKVGTDLMQTATQLGNSMLNEFSTGVKDFASDAIKNPSYVLTSQNINEKITSSVNNQIDNANTAINDYNQLSERYTGGALNIKPINKIGSGAASGADFANKLGGADPDIQSRTPSESLLSSIPLMTHGGRDDSQYVTDSTYEVKTDGTGGLRGSKQPGDPFYDAIPDDHPFVGVDSILSAGDNKVMFEAWYDKFNEISMTPHGIVRTVIGKVVSKDKWIGGSFYTDGTGKAYVEGSDTSIAQTDLEKSYVTFQPKTIELDEKEMVWQTKEVKEQFKKTVFEPQEFVIREQVSTDSDGNIVGGVWVGGTITDGWWWDGSDLEFPATSEGEAFWLKLKEDNMAEPNPTWTTDDLIKYTKILYDDYKVFFETLDMWTEYKSTLTPSSDNYSKISDWEKKMFKSKDSKRSFESQEVFEQYANDRLKGIRGQSIKFEFESDYDTIDAQNASNLTSGILADMLKDLQKEENKKLELPDETTWLRYRELSGLSAEELDKIEDANDLYKTKDMKVQYFTFSSDDAGEAEFLAFEQSNSVEQVMDPAILQNVRGKLYTSIDYQEYIHTTEGPPQYPADKIGFIAIENFNVSDMTTEVVESISSGVYGDIPIALVAKQPQQLDITFIADAEMYTLRWIVDYQKYMLGSSLAPGYMRPYKKCCTEITLYATRFNRQTVYAKTYYCMPLFNTNMSLLGEGVKRFPTSWVILGSSEYKCAAEFTNETEKKETRTYVEVPSTPPTKPNLEVGGSTNIYAENGSCSVAFPQDESESINSLVVGGFTTSVSDPSFSNSAVKSMAAEAGISEETISKLSENELVKLTAEKLGIDGVLDSVGLIKTNGKTVVVSYASWEYLTLSGSDNFSKTDRSIPSVNTRFEYNNNLSLERGIECVLALYGDGVQEVKLVAAGHRGVDGAYPYVNEGLGADDSQCDVAAQGYPSYNGIYQYAIGSELAHVASDKAYSNNRRADVFIYGEGKYNSKFYAKYPDFSKMGDLKIENGSKLTYDIWAADTKLYSKENLVKWNKTNTSIMPNYV